MVMNLIYFAFGIFTVIFIMRFWKKVIHSYRFEGSQTFPKIGVTTWKVTRRDHTTFKLKVVHDKHQCVYIDGYDQVDGEPYARVAKPYKEEEGIDMELHESFLKEYLYYKAPQL